ncbi:MAG: hypothetical protein E7616_09640 [Ruminococcaceae bacterium]|nr:hypothetical protein [Oscillospiraceae bacterium]
MLTIYNKVKAVPDNAKKAIKAGRLKGMTDINPMWRIKTLTEQFGPCGIGWKPQIVRTWIDEGANGEYVTNVEILLFIKVNGAWSDGIPGIGGSKLVAKETGGLYTDDECYKKAYTDAISVACKALGIGADVYWDADRTKYTVLPEPNNDPAPDPIPPVPPKPPAKPKSDKQTEIMKMIAGTNVTPKNVAFFIADIFGDGKKVDDLTDSEFADLKQKILETVRAV